ncbi:hypothetical protein [Azorhizobium oxalatiphilum]|uniref:hypothetical protein n=1 Tax=Azorhizobium oxalatiphilum TaxID=980631 RepID=UPI00166AF514|nr:hypothetical protein [Azorhizobium oxalatiphilum]
MLERLWDAADVLHAKGQPCDGYDISHTTLMAAAASGTADDIKSATVHLEAYLRGRALI